MIHAQAFRSDLPSNLAEKLSNAALRRDTGELDRTMAAIRAHAKHEAKAEAEMEEASVRKAERDAIDMLSLRTRAKTPQEEINAYGSLLHARGPVRPHSTPRWPPRSCRAPGSGASRRQAR